MGQNQENKDGIFSRSIISRSGSADSDPDQN